ncbi:MAG: hypothetical protein ACTHJN_15410 [Ginsengibacter sp.]|jgi:hypothetical protein
MIGYFLKAGDESVSEMFSPYIWKEHGFGTLFESAYLNKSYGNDLKLILIMYYVQGKFNVNGPENLKVNNYSNKKKDISVAITVLPDQFHNRNEFDRREFIVDSTLKAIKLVRDKLSKKKNLEIKFEELKSDVLEIADEYLRYKL